MACASCVRRGILLRDLAGNIDRAVHNAAGHRARELLALDDRELAEAVTPDSNEAERALAVSAGRACSGAFEEELATADSWAICRHQPGWPEAFGRLGAAAPNVLHGRGDRDLLAAGAESPAVTIVGARRASSYGRQVAQGLAAELAGAGIVVVSGLAFGVDSAAHRGALDAGATVAVLGSGPDRAYPRSAASLYERICDRGLIVSELPPGTPTFRWTFPARNRLMAALGEITVVVEAAERSGSLITAEMAVEAGRGVGAVPGPVNSWRSSGTNRLLLDGASLVRDGKDVLDQIFGAGAATPRVSEPAVAGDQALVLDLIEAGARTIDQIADRGGLAFSDSAAALAALELAGHVFVDSDGSYGKGGSRGPTMPP